MPLITPQQQQQLIENYRIASQIEAAGGNSWHLISPVALLHTPEIQVGSPGAWESCRGTWLLIDANPEHPDRVGMLGDLGFGVVEYGVTSLETLERIGPGPNSQEVAALPFVPAFPVAVYLRAADIADRITTETEDLFAAARKVAAEVAKAESLAREYEAIRAGKEDAA